MTNRARLLIVDDEAIVASSFQRALEALLPDCEVAIALSGEEALQLFAQRPFDVLITDYRMPGVDGLTLALRVRQSYPGTATIMVSGNTHAIRREQAARASIRHFVDKPVKPAQICRLVLEALGRPDRWCTHPRTA